MRVLVLLVLSLGLAWGQSFPELSGRVVDQAGILSPGTEAALTEQLARWEEQSSDQIVVVTVESLGDLGIERYGVELGRAWGLGVDRGTDGRGLNNGALLIIAPNDAAVRIEVGYGLEGTLTDALSSVIIQQGMLPAFRQGDFDLGAMRGVEGILGVLSGEEAEWMDRRRRAGERPVAEGEGEFPWPLLFFLIVFILPGIFRSRKRILFDSDTGRRRGRGELGADALALIIASELMRGGSGRGGWSSGGRSGGGFSGGGGSFGGGGASGSW